MKPRFLFRGDNGRVIRTTREHDWIGGAIATLVIVALLGWAHRGDEKATADAKAWDAAHAAGFEAGRAAGREDAYEDATSRIRAAYEAGLNDGVYASNGKPEGLALAQACAALRVAYADRGARP